MIFYFIPLFMYISLIHLATLYTLSKRHKFSWTYFIKIIVLSPILAILWAEAADSNAMLMSQLEKSKKKIRELRLIAYGKDSSKSS
jgi:hypothetical protein